jgi:hypothetical protein
MAKRSAWTRWGRGSCEGWSLEIGGAFCGSVVWQGRTKEPPTWLASVNATYLGEYLDRAAAMARVAQDIERNMELVLHDWAVYQAAKGAPAKKCTG